MDCFSNFQNIVEKLLPYIEDVSIDYQQQHKYYIKHSLMPSKLFGKPSFSLTEVCMKSNNAH